MRDMCRWQPLAAACVVAAAQAAHGGLISFTPFEGTQTPDVQDLGLNLNMLNQGNTVDLVFSNDSSVHAVITSIYIESRANSAGVLLNPQILPAQMPGVDFQLGASPPNPPGSIAQMGGAWGGTLHAFSARAPSPHNGIAPGESLTVRFELGDTWQTLIDLQSTSPPKFRIAQHIQSIGEDGTSAWTVGHPAPTPGSGVLAAAAIGLIALRRRR